MLGHGRDFGHEGGAAQFALLHLSEFVFPFTREFWLGEFFDLQAAQQRHQLKGFGRRNHLAAFAQHVFFVDQAFNRGGAGGGRAQAFFLHGFSQLVIVDHLARAFHGTQQRGF